MSVAQQSPGPPFGSAGDLRGGGGKGPGRLVLVRTGATVATAEGVLAGVNDVPLTELGIEQARQAGQLLSDLQVSGSLPYFESSSGYST